MHIRRRALQICRLKQVARYGCSRRCCIVGTIAEVNPIVVIWLLAKPGRSTLYLSTSVLKYNL